STATAITGSCVQNTSLARIWWRAPRHPWRCHARPGSLAPREPYFQDREDVNDGRPKNEHGQNRLTFVTEIVCNGTSEGRRRVLPELVARLLFARTLQKERH